jgi:hypothetical protein
MRFGWLGALMKAVAKGAEVHDVEEDAKVVDQQDTIDTSPAAFDAVLDAREKADGEVGPNA